MNIRLVTFITAASPSGTLKFVIPNGRSDRRNLLFRRERDERQALLRLYPREQEPVSLCWRLRIAHGSDASAQVPASGFHGRYRIDRLVYFETFRYVNNAIVRETEIKAWRREKKVALIAANNPT